MNPTVYDAAQRLTGALKAAGVCSDVIGRRFIFVNATGEPAVIEGTITGATLSSNAELDLYVSVPRFLGFDLTRLEYGEKSKMWRARTTVTPRGDEPYDERYASIPGYLDIFERPS